MQTSNKSIGAVRFLPFILSFDDLDVDGAASRRVEFGKIDVLPPPEKKFSVGDDERFGRAHDAAFYVAIAVAFVVAKFRHLREDLVHGKVHVFCHEFVGIFVNGDGRRGMRAIDEADALFYAAPLYKLVHLVGDVEKSRSFRLQRK